MITRMIILIGAFVFLTNCTEEAPDFNIKITPKSNVINAKEPLEFEIEGNADFLVFYSGVEEEKYDDYPNAIAKSIDMFNDNPMFSHTYNMHGEVEAVFIASSYGNWSETEIEEVFKFKINVVDNITRLSSVKLKTSGLFGKEFVGEIDNNEKKVVVSIPPNYSISNLTTNISTESPRAEVYLNGEVFKNNSVVDFSGEEVIFNVISIGGEEQEWVIEISRE